MESAGDRFRARRHLMGAGARPAAQIDAYTQEERGVLEPMSGESIRPAIVSAS